MVFEAFTTEVVVDNFPRTITSLCLWGEQVLVGLQDGSLLFFQRQSGVTPGTQPSWQVWKQFESQQVAAALRKLHQKVVKTHRDVERKSVLQMVAVTLPITSTTPGVGVAKPGKATTRQDSGNSEGGNDRSSTRQPAGVADVGTKDAAPPSGKPLLLSLTDDGVNVRSLPDGMLRYQASRSKGGSCMAWCETRRQLAVSVKRRVQLLALVAQEKPGGGSSRVMLEEVLDVAAPDLLQTMMWAGDSLFLGSKKAYYLMLASGGPSSRPQSTAGAPPATSTGLQMSSLLPTTTSSNPTTPAAGPTSGPTQLVLQAGEVCSVGVALGASIAVAAASGEVLLVRDSTVVCLDAMGQMTRRAPITFSEPPLSLAVGAHYAVGLLPSGAEVRSLRRGGDGSAVQRLPDLMEARITAAPGMATDGSLFVGLVGDKGVRRLVPVPLSLQAEALAREGQYSEALLIAGLLDDQISDQRTALEDRLRLLYAHHLFASHEWDEGMAQLTLCSERVGVVAPVLVLLRTLPALVPPKLRHWLPNSVAGAQLPKVEEPSGTEFAAAASRALPYLTSCRSRTMAAHPELVSGRVAWSENAVASSGPAAPVDAATTSAGKDSTTSGGKDPTTSAGIGPSLHLDMNTGTDGAPDGEVEDRPISRDVTALPDPETLLVLVDSGMVAALLSQQEDTGTLLRFLQLSPHWVDLQEGARMLQAAGRYAELAALYKYYGMHDQALTILHQASQSPDSMQPRPTGAAADLRGLPGVWAAVRYLTHLGNAHAELIRRHSAWILKADPEAGLQAFLQMRQPLQPSLALDILHAHSPAYAGMYLEAALELGVAAPQDYHTDLLLIYLREILDREHEPSSSYSEEDSEEELAATEQAPSAETAASAATGTPGAAATVNTRLPAGLPPPSLGAAPSKNLLLSPVGRKSFAAGRLSDSETKVLMRLAHGHKHHIPPLGRSANLAGAAAAALAEDWQPSSGTDGSGGIVAPVASAPPQVLRQTRSMAVHRRHRLSSSPSHGNLTLNSLLDPMTQYPGASPQGPLPLFPDRPAPRRQAVLKPTTDSEGAGAAGDISAGPTPPSSAPTTDDEGSAAAVLLGRRSGAARASHGRNATSVSRKTARKKGPVGAAVGRPSEPAAAQDLERIMSDAWRSAPVGAFEAAVADSGGKPKEQAETKASQEVAGKHAAESQPPTQVEQGDQLDGLTGNAAEDTIAMGGTGKQKLHVERKPSPKEALQQEVGSQDEGAAEQGPAPPPRRRRRPLYQRLRDLVFSSPYLDPQHVLSSLPQGELPEIRALMLERLGCHREALQLYCHVLQDMSMAEAYCDRVYAAETASQGNNMHGESNGRDGLIPTSSGDAAALQLSNDRVTAAPRELLVQPEDIYLLLLKVVLDGPDAQQWLQQQQPSPQAQSATTAISSSTAAATASAKEGGSLPVWWSELVWVLARKVGCVDPQHVIEAVPPQLPLEWCMPFYNAALAHAGESRRANAVRRQLRRSENLALKAAAGSERAGRILLTIDRTCCLCYKRLGLAVFVAYPDLSVAHYQCHKRRHPGQPTVVLQPPAAQPLQPSSTLTLQAGPPPLPFSSPAMQGGGFDSASNASSALGMAAQGPIFRPMASSALPVNDSSAVAGEDGQQGRLHAVGGSMGDLVGRRSQPYDIAGEAGGGSLQAEASMHHHSSSYDVSLGMNGQGLGAWGSNGDAHPKSHSRHGSGVPTPWSTTSQDLKQHGQANHWAASDSAPLRAVQHSGPNHHAGEQSKVAGVNLAVPTSLLD